MIAGPYNIWIHEAQERLAGTDRKASANCGVYIIRSKMQSKSKGPEC
jgi:hypothetical protein